MPAVEPIATSPVREPARPQAPARRSSGLGRALAIARLVHPFPSLLDGLVVGVVATVAGAAPGRAGMLGLSTVLLQFAIGTLNDLVDRPIDAVRRTGKPLAEGLVSQRAATAVLVTCAAAGLVLALLGGPLLLLLAAAGLGLGVWYDLAAKGTGLSWLPIALGVPLLPVYGWLGATGALPPAFTVLVPAAALAGAALAIANALADIERDEAAGATSIAAVLGPYPSAVLVLVLQAVVGALALLSSASSGATGAWFAAAAAASLIPVAGAGLGLLRANRGSMGREVAFEIQGVGLALLAVAWVNAWSVGAA